VSGSIVLIENAPQPNASTLFINWLLSKNGQTAFTRASARPTRGLDVDAQWTKECGRVSPKETLSPEKYDEMENGSQEIGLKVCKPAIKLAEKLFQ